jgi:hypothetical protein
MQQQFRALLRSSAAVTSHVPSTRINWGEHPQGAGKPYIHMMMVSENEGLTLQGREGLEMGRVQVDCYAPTYLKAREVAQAVKALLHGHRGGGFRLIEHVATRDSREAGTNEAERLFRVSMDFTTHWRPENAIYQIAGR